DVEGAGRDVVAVDVVERGGDAARERNAAAPDPEEREFARAAVAFENFVGNARERAGHAVGVHHLRHGGLRTRPPRGCVIIVTSWRPHGTAVKEWGLRMIPKKGDNRHFSQKKGTADSNGHSGAGSGCPLFFRINAVVPFF